MPSDAHRASTSIGGNSALTWLSVVAIAALASCALRRGLRMLAVRRGGRVLQYTPVAIRKIGSELNLAEKYC